MDKETQDYILSLNEHDAETLLRKAKNEAGLDGYGISDTPSFKTFKQVRDALIALARGGTRLKLNSLRFIYHTNQDHWAHGYYWGRA